MIRVYPPSRVATFGATSRNKTATWSLLFKVLNTTLLECVESVLDFVISGSTNLRSVLAFATVVVMRLCSISEHAMLESIELLWLAVRLNALLRFPCLMLFQIEHPPEGATVRFTLYPVYI